MDRAYVECLEVTGQRIEMLRCYDSALGAREEIVFADGSMFVWLVVSDLRGAGELIRHTQEGFEVARRYPFV